MAYEVADEDRYIGVEKLSDLVDVPVQTIYQWRRLGKGPKGVRVGRFIRFRVGDVRAWLDAGGDRPEAS